MAWLKNPLPGTPFKSDVMGTKAIETTSGLDWIVSNHSSWARNLSLVPPFLLYLTARSCLKYKGKAKQCKISGRRPLAHYHKKMISYTYILACVRPWRAGVHESQSYVPSIRLEKKNAYRLRQSIQKNMLRYSLPNWLQINNVESQLKNDKSYIQSTLG